MTSEIRDLQIRDEQELPVLKTVGPKKVSDKGNM